VDIDTTTGKTIHYNISFALETLRTQKNQGSQMDPELSDTTLKALMFLKFNAGPAGISLQALLGKSTELVIWSDVKTALRIFRQVCHSFIHPQLGLHVARLFTQVEDLRTQYPAISAPHWVRIFHTTFAKLRGVNAIFAANPNLDYSIMLQTLFELDTLSPLFQEVFMATTLGQINRSASRGSSPPKKRQKKNLPTAMSSITGRNQIPVSSSKKLSNVSKIPRPRLQGEYPCYNWICNRSPCFASATCAVIAQPGSKRGIPRPHEFAVVDKAMEDEFREWVLKYANN
jgi:hypothetical protein